MPPIPAPIPAPILAPLRRLKAQTRATAAVTSIAIIICTWWAMSSPSYPPIQTVTLTKPQQGIQTDVQTPLNLAAFDALIWRSPVKPVVAQSQNTPTRTPPPPKLNVELVAITSDASDDTVKRRAALYDPGKNMLLLLAEGDHIGDFTLTVINAESVMFTAGDHVAALRLRTDQPQLALRRKRR